jgi:pimeloyl-ACP methyl ester carboxylesterase
LKDLGIKQTIVIGHSLGGYVALSLLVRHPERLAGIALFHSTPFADTEERKKVREKVIQFVQLNGVPPFIETFVPGLFADKQNPFIKSARQRAMTTRQDALIGYAMAMRDRPDRSMELLQSPLPCLVLAGTQDSLIPFDHLQKYAQKSENCMFSELPETAHMGIFEAKKQSQATISRFIALALQNK